jgi:hypothetical protein
MSKKLRNIACFALIAMISCFIVAGVHAQINTEDFNVQGIAYNAGLNSTATPGAAISNVIKIVLALLGVIALIIIIMGGFKWMTSGGDSAKIEEAKKLMGAGIVGMVIVLFAYIIQQFIVQLITGATNGGTTTGNGA